MTVKQIKLLPNGKRQSKLLNLRYLQDKNHWNRPLTSYPLDKKTDIKLNISFYAIYFFYQVVNLEYEFQNIHIALVKISLRYAYNQKLGFRWQGWN